MSSEEDCVVSETFDQIKGKTAEGKDYFDARRLLSLLGCEDFSDQTKIIHQLMNILEQQKLDVHRNIWDKRNVPNSFYFSRYTCYLASVLAEKNTPIIEEARAYFIVKEQDVAPLSIRVEVPMRRDMSYFAHLALYVGVVVMLIGASFRG